MPACRRGRVVMVMIVMVVMVVMVVLVVLVVMVVMVVVIVSHTVLPLPTAPAYYRFSPSLSPLVS